MPKFMEDELPKINHDEVASVSSEEQEYASATQSPKDEGSRLDMADRGSTPATGVTRLNGSESLSKLPSPPQNGGVGDKPIKDEAKLNHLLAVLDDVTPEVAQQAVLKHWRKCMTGNTGCEIYYISELIQAATSETLSRAMSNPRTQREIIESMSSKAKHEIIDRFFKDAQLAELMPVIHALPQRVKKEIIDRYMHESPPIDIIQSLQPRVVIDILPPRIKHEIIDLYIKEAPAQELLTLLARADRLGFSMDDIMDDEENTMPNNQGLIDHHHQDHQAQQKRPEPPHYQYPPYPVQHHQHAPPPPAFEPPPPRVMSTPAQQPPLLAPDRVESPSQGESPQALQDGTKHKARLGGTCPECGRKFTQKHSQQTHVEQQVCWKKSKEMDPARPYDPSRTRYECPGCDFKFAHPHAQEYHITNNHCGKISNPDGSSRLPPRATGPPPAAAALPPVTVPPPTATLPPPAPRTSGFQPINGISRSEESKKRLNSALQESQTYVPAGSPAAHTPGVRTYQVDPRTSQPLGWSIPSRPSPLHSTPHQQSPIPVPANRGNDDKYYDHLSPEKNREINIEFDKSQAILDQDIRDLDPSLPPGEREVAARRAKGRFYARNNGIRRQFEVPIQENRKKDRTSTGSSAATPTPGISTGKKRRGRPSRYDVAAYQAQVSPIPPSQIVRAPAPQMMAPGSGHHQSQSGIPRPDWLGYYGSSTSTPPVQNGRHGSDNQTPQLKRPSLGSVPRPQSRDSEYSNKRQRTDDSQSDVRSTSAEKPRVPIDAAQRKWERIQGTGGSVPIENLGAGESAPPYARDSVDRRNSLNNMAEKGKESGKEKTRRAEAVYISSDEDTPGNDDEDEEIPAVRPTSNSGNRGLIPRGSLTPPKKMMARRGGGHFSPRGSTNRREFGGGNG